MPNRTFNRNRTNPTRGFAPTDAERQRQNAARDGNEAHASRGADDPVAEEARETDRMGDENRDTPAEKLGDGDEPSGGEQGGDDDEEGGQGGESVQGIAQGESRMDGRGPAKRPGGRPQS